MIIIIGHSTRHLFFARYHARAWIGACRVDVEGVGWCACVGWGFWRARVRGARAWTRERGVRVGWGIITSMARAL